MGSGKTTFISALCSFLAVEDVISSPTYAIVNEYESPIVGTIYHMDWYRFNSMEDAISSGVEELLNDGLCLIEWPEKAPSLLPENIFSIMISLEPNGARKLTTNVI
jgi:tRNA threonylcarbamoyladenosine biosynthesis protein TsaE